MANFPPPQLKKAAEDVASLLKSRGETICVAETAAGGLISSALLSTPGASRIYKGGLTLYTLESRIAFAGWSQENIKAYDGPTPKLVEGLASSVRETLKATYCVGEVGSRLISFETMLTRISRAQQDRVSHLFPLRPLLIRHKAFHVLT
jgi:nicotinamide mononucleotide (NMN) deamidase PncC